MRQNEDGSQQKLQQQQQCQIAMMPVLMNADGTFSQQFVPMPMTTMATHIFNTMGVTSRQPQLAQPSSEENQQQDQQNATMQPEDRDVGAQHLQQDQQVLPEDTNTREESHPPEIEGVVTATLKSSLNDAEPAPGTIIWSSSSNTQSCSSPPGSGRETGEGIDATSIVKSVSQSGDKLLSGSIAASTEPE